MGSNTASNCDKYGGIWMFGLRPASSGPQNNRRERRPASESGRYNGRAMHLQECGGERAESSAERRAERGEKSAAAARSIGAGVKQLRRNAETMREQIGIHAE